MVLVVEKSLQLNFMILEVHRSHFGIHLTRNYFSPRLVQILAESHSHKTKDSINLSSQK